MDNDNEEYYDYNYMPAISFIRIGIGLTQQFDEEQEQQEQQEQQLNKKRETMPYYKIMLKLYQELKNRK
jgi:hypothetical protein